MFYCLNCFNRRFPWIWDFPQFSSLLLNLNLETSLFAISDINKPRSVIVINHTTSHGSSDHKGNPTQQRPGHLDTVLKYEKQVRALKWNWMVTQGKDRTDTCLWVDVLWLRSGRWVAEGVGMDWSARDRMLSCSWLKLRETRVVPSGCLIQVTAKTRQV